MDLGDVVLHGPRLTLRPWQDGDAGRLVQIMQDRSVYEFMAFPDPYDAPAANGFLAEAGARRASGAALECAVAETATGRLVGSATLRLSEEPDVGYWIAPDAQGASFAAEATRVLTDWAFARGLPRVGLWCDVRNVGSARTALAAGFRYEGAARDKLRRTVAGVERVSDLAGFARLAVDPPDPVPPAFSPWPRAGLTDGTVLLRLLVPEDADAFLAQEVDPVTVGSGFTGMPPSPAAARRLADRARLDGLVGSTMTLALEDVATGHFAGTVRIRHPGPPGVGGIGYAMHPAFRGRGYTARGLRLLATWAFGPGGFARLELGAKADNMGSQKAALAAGFEPDGVRAARLRYPEGSYADEVRFALINPTTPRR